MSPQQELADADGQRWNDAVDGPGLPPGPRIPHPSLEQQHVTTTEHPRGSVASYVERLRRHADNPIYFDSCVVGIIEGILHFGGGTDDAETLQHIRHALAAAAIVRAEQVEIYTVDAYHASLEP